VKDLLQSRKEIDVIDETIIQLFEKRMEICKDVADYKLKTGKPVLDRQRELDKIAALKEKASDNFYAHGVEELFEQIMAMSRKMQYKLLNEEGINNDIGFDIVAEIPKQDVKVVYQGIPGAYQQQAAKEYFGDGAEYCSVPTFREAMKYVRDGKADYAVLPFENSSAGIVADVYDLLVEFSNCIVDTFDVKVEHCLCGLPGTKIEDIKEVYSHPQALMQSKKFIDKYGWNAVNAANTAISARFISEQNDKSRACIASENAAEIYGLEVIHKGINYNATNTTKFIIISRHKIARRDAGLICISFEMPHESGTLYQMLSHIIYNDLNMTSIQSRPLPDKKWEYRFYVEFEGKSTQAGVVNALSGINAEALNMKILGNY
jgi:chorismate mutase/prephenate dehydratase